MTTQTGIRGGQVHMQLCTLYYIVSHAEHFVHCIYSIKMSAHLSIVAQDFFTVLPSNAAGLVSPKRHTGVELVVSVHPETGACSRINSAFHEREQRRMQHRCKS